MDTEKVQKSMMSRLDEIEILYDLDESDKNMIVFFIDLAHKIGIKTGFNIKRMAKAMNAAATVMSAWDEEWDKMLDGTRND